jgi:hypothetical protein
MKVSSARLAGLTKELRVQWQDTKHYWRDAKSLEFESRYMEELLASVDRTVTVIEQLDKLMSKIRKDCE